MSAPRLPRQLLTNSRLDCYAQCPFKHHCRYVLCARPPDAESPAMLWGTLVHSMLETWWNGDQT